MIQRVVARTMISALSGSGARASAAAVSIGARRTFSDNVTYSGGQAGVQGGFYGAGGARSQVSPHGWTDHGPSPFPTCLSRGRYNNSSKWSTTGIDRIDRAFTLHFATLLTRPSASLPPRYAAESVITTRAHHRPEAVAALDDIRRLREAVQQVSDMEIELGRLGSAVSGRSIELKSTIKKRLSSPNMLELLTRLEINNQPVWGLTQEERELVRIAREKVNSC